ncbi:hypothetical protein HQ325_16675 [Rhodococcus sp. BP-349]|uniref:hypothetical protein n=1 Tax=unclassified Rhodococcus (in: high G+C Gram-positive bacteria) TaxID=192944 RepID=UPI001C9B609C|nr:MULTISPECIES: hypothetical protein [unclassified Rhodococcus (in: high G+C Gram-positive bacteria)]MBY6540310.1 hypothetical protein [Rhodococcus sp. BP-363]MBY6545665.1 hypothetical protein [Rhodococcus sp. BP-369]MBY6564895.1 hypothetical protein [Rhodococcus sp. BP-370]MBY6578169.1 hypothetical protein [Rhodococcus sp. BP-364]MBY6587470.1 hypothetical protein [Rhodococcus sp. BP-358]
MDEFQTDYEISYDLKHFDRESTEQFPPDSSAHWRLEFVACLIRTLTTGAADGFFRVEEITVRGHELTTLLTFPEAGRHRTYGMTADIDHIRSGYNSVAAVAAKEWSTDLVQPAWDPERVEGGICWRRYPPLSADC